MLEAVVNDYKYTSLHELNAVLNQYNVLADGGTVGSRIHQHKGLVYRVLDNYGVATGVPVKASLFYNKPTLKFLERKFKENDVTRRPYQGRVKNAIDRTLLGKPLALSQLASRLEKQGIHTVLRLNESGLVYGVTFVDYQTKTVFNGSDLGKMYSAKGLQDRCVSEAESEQLSRLKPSALRDVSLSSTAARNTNDQSSSPLSEGNAVLKIIEAVIKPEQATDTMPGQFKKKKKRKRLNRPQ